MLQPTIKLSKFVTRTLLNFCIVTFIGLIIIRILLLGEGLKFILELQGA